jgi:polyhydroxyalkanoate synthesis regulator phasin
MSESTTLIKKAVLTSVGATSNLERIKIALNDAMQDVVKIGQDLVDELEEQGKIKTDNAQSFLRGLQDEATKRTGQIEKKVTEKVQEKARDFGFVSREEYEELIERLEALEKANGLQPPSNTESKKNAKSNKKSKKEESSEEESAE